MGFAGKQVAWVKKLMWAAFSAIILSVGGTTLAITVEPVKRQAEDEKMGIRMDYIERDIESKAPMWMVQEGMKLVRDFNGKQDTIIKLLKENNKK